jgi:exonuclease III
MMPFAKKVSPLMHALILILLLIRGLPPNPGPHQSNFIFLQININGIRNSFSELSNFLQQHSVEIACIQETRLTVTAKSPVFPGNALLRRDHHTGGGGRLVILVHDTISFTNLDASHFAARDNFTELLAISANIGGSWIDVYNVYIPPHSASHGFIPDFNELLNL